MLFRNDSITDEKKLLEEYKTYIGVLMLDCRSSWGANYKIRLEDLRDTLEEMLKLPNLDEVEKAAWFEDKTLVINELNEEFQDGRIFRDCANLYGYTSEEGLSNRVVENLGEICEYPENIKG